MKEYFIRAVIIICILGLLIKIFNPELIIEYLPDAIKVENGDILFALYGIGFLIFSVLYFKNKENDMWGKIDRYFSAPLLLVFSFFCFYLALVNPF